MVVVETNAALKEWAVVCQVLADGRQTLLIRKGGIRELKRGFEVTHREFWLYPTYVHQKTQDLIPAVHAEFAAVQAGQPPPGALRIQLFATVADMVNVTDLERLRSLEGHHILSWDCVASRFRYRDKPGVHVMVLRVYRTPQPIELETNPVYDGCVSWVELEAPLSAAGCLPVLTDADFGARLAEIRRRLDA